MNRDELEGKADALKGEMKQAAGTLTRDPDLHDEGVVDEVAGKPSDVSATRRTSVIARTFRPFDGWGARWN
jgi:uncharacterized protein YjbJ (UPF0337 family)